MMCEIKGKWWFRHDWSEWQSNREPLVRTRHSTGEEIQVGFIIEQHRKCNRCGKVETEISRHTI